MKIGGLPKAVKAILEETAKKLSGAKRREYIAMVTIKILDGNARKAERVFGWSRTTVKKGIRELATERKCIDIYSARGNKKTDEKIQKTKPLKKIPETDAIFENVDRVKSQADESLETLRLSIDTKAKVKIGDFFPRWKTREKEPEGALDHDVAPDAQLVLGYFEPANDFLSIIFGTSLETSDFIVDCLEQWWEENKGRHSLIKELVINHDNGPHINSRRTQFIKRMTEFVDKTGLILRLICYPPYHSKYNPIERCGGILEEHWNGTLLSSIENALEWAGTMTWNGVRPVVHLLDAVYQKGVKLTKEAMKIYEAAMQLLVDRLGF